MCADLQLPIIYTVHAQAEINLQSTFRFICFLILESYSAKLCLFLEWMDMETNIKEFINDFTQFHSLFDW
jgi:hypothetical protein